LPSDFLHYGFFDDVQRKPADISLSDIIQAQNRYAELLLELAGDCNDPVLDVGCGMGGLSRMAIEKGFAPTALTPDRLQASHILKTLPDVPVIRSKFEALKAEDHAAKYGTIFTAESLQYLKLDVALPLLKRIIKPGGKWVACDYFLNTPSDDRTCHNWDAFQARLIASGWKLTFQRDITANVLPTLAFLHMLASRFGLPLMGFAKLRLQRKQPALHHMLGGVLSQLDGVVADNISLIEPTQFKTNRRYMMLVMQRSESIQD